MTTQSITYDARIAGRTVPNVIEITTSAGFDQINSEATIWTTARPSWADERTAVEIWVKNSGTGTGQIFGGEVTGFNWTYAPTKIGIICGDLLARTRDAWGGDDYEYTSQASDAIVRNALEKKSIPSSKAHIEGSGWVTGTINPVELKSGDDVYDTLIAPLDDVEGYKTFSLTSGVIVRQRVTGIPGASAALTFSKGVEILANPRRNRTAIGIVNRVIWTGVDYEGLTVGGPGVGEASAPNPYVTDPSGFTTERLQSNLIETDGDALTFARQRVSDKNRRPENGEFRFPLDPRVQPGMTVQIVHPDLEYGTLTAFCMNVQHSISSAGALTTIRTTGGNISGAALQAPVANFTVQLYLEGEDTGSGVNSVVVGVCDGSQSYDPDGTIASYAWTVTGTGGTPAPSSGSGSTFRFAVTGATQVVVTLVVTDADAQTGTMALTVPISSSAVLVEDLYLAYGNVACSSDGEQTWRTATPASGNATCLAAFAPAWGEVWGTSTGHIYATFDKLETALIDFGAPHGAVACTALWVHEVDQTRLWAGFSDGKVYQGTVDTTGQTCTFTLAGTITGGPSIVEIRESYGTFGELRATAGTSYYYSVDSGASWTLVHTFDTAWRMAAGFDTNLASGLNDAAPIYDEDGTPPTVPGGVTHIRGLTFGWRTQALYATDNAANLYTTDSTFAALTEHTDNLNARGNHMIRSGNIDGPVIYIGVGDGTGVNNGFQKWIPDVKAPFYIRKTGSAQGYMIGYGALHAPPVQIELLMVDKTGGGVWHQVGGIWADATGDLTISSRNWRGITVSPVDKADWIIWEKAHAYRTTNGGVNWTELAHGVGTDLTNVGVTGLNTFAFSPDGTSWAFTAEGYDAGFNTHQGLAYRGTATTVSGGHFWNTTGSSTAQGTPRGLTWLSNTAFAFACDHATDNGGFSGRWRNLNSTQWGSGTSGTGNAIGDADAQFRTIDYSSTPGLVGLSSGPGGSEGHLWRTTAPTTTGPNDETSVGANSDATVAATTLSTYLGSTSGVVQVATGGGSAVVALAGMPVVCVRSDRQAHTAVAALGNPSGTTAQIALFDGGTWQSVTPPPVGTNVLAQLASWIEVITL